MIVLSYGMWQERFGGSRGILGRVLTIDRQPYEVVGVMPESFAFPRRVQAWRPADVGRPTSGAGLAEGAPESRQARYLGVIGRLRFGVRLAQAEQEMAGVAAALARTYPIDDSGWTTKLEPLRDSVVGSVKRVLVLVLGAVGLVLALACATVANLTLGRAIAREPEIALRSALGAGRGRLHAQLITESLVVALIGGTLGALAAWAGLRAFVGLAPTNIPRLAEVTLDGRVLAFTLGVAAITGVLCGLAPSVRVAGVGTATLLREAGRGGAGSRRSDAVRRMLVVSQMALAVLLLVGAGLMLRSVSRILAVNPGYATEGVVAGRVTLDGERYRGNRAKVLYLRELTRRIAAMPGVRQVGVTTTLPLTPAGIDFDLAYHPEGHPTLPPNQAPEVDFRVISPGYVEAMGIRLLEGRAFTERDRIERASDGPTATPNADVRSPKAMLVNETFARQNWPGQSAVGKHVGLFYFESDPWEVVGVIADTRHAALVSPPRPQVFVPVEQTELLFGFLTIVVRTAPGASGIAAGHARRGVGGGSERAALRHRHHRGPPVGRDGTIANDGPAVLGVRARGGGPRCRGDLRGDLLPGGASHSGDRRAHGARREPRAGRPRCRRRGCGAGRCRCGVRHDRRARGGSLRARDAVRRRTNGPADVRLGGGAAHGGRDRGGVGAGREGVGDSAGRGASGGLSGLACRASIGTLVKSVIARTNADG